MNERKDNVVPLRLVTSPAPESVEVLERLDAVIAEAEGGGRLALALALATRLAALATRILDESCRPAPVREAAGPTRLISVDEAAEAAGVTRRWIYDHTRGMKFRHDLSSRRVRIDEAGFRRWLESRRR